MFIILPRTRPQTLLLPLEPKLPPKPSQLTAFGRWPGARGDPALGPTGLYEDLGASEARRGNDPVDTVATAATDRRAATRRRKVEDWGGWFGWFLGVVRIAKGWRLT